MHVCNICGKEFKQKCHLENHKNKKNPCIKSEKQKEIDTLKCEFENMLIEFEKIKNEKEQLIKENEELKNKNNLDVSITSNNVNINTGVINNNNINVIKIIDHGKEDYSKIDIKKIMMDNPVLPNLNYISTVIYHVHCNDNLPEYHNIYVSDINRNRAMIYNDGKWMSTDKEIAMDKLFNNIVSCVDDVTENTSSQNKFINYINEIQKVNPFGKNYTKKNRKTALSNSEHLLYDNKTKIMAVKNIDEKPKTVIKNK